jgi:hypothetical protein
MTRQMLITALGAVTVTLTAVAAFAAGVQVGQTAATLPPCLTEDDVRDCHWVASTRGNGRGDSFIRYNGETYHLAR